MGIVTMMFHVHVFMLSFINHFLLFARDCAVKFNDYFEFPRELNVEPFTVDGLAKIEGEIIEEDVSESSSTNKTADTVEDECESTEYRLMGVVVHSGQASGGHYYSYIIPRFVTMCTFLSFQSS